MESMIETVDDMMDTLSIAEDVETFFVTENGKYIYYINEDDELFYQKGTVTQLKATLHTAAQVSFRRTAITVEHQLNGCAGSILVELSVEGQSVEGGNGKRFIGQCFHFSAPAFHLLPLNEIHLNHELEVVIF